MSTSDQRIIVLECVCINHIVFCPCPSITCRSQDTAPAAEQHTQNKKWTRMLTLPVQHVPALSPHSKLPSDRGRVARSTWFDFPAFCVGVLPCPADGLVHTDARRKSRERHKEDFRKKHHCAYASQATLRGLKNCLATMSNFFFSRERWFYGPVLTHNQVSWEEVTKTNPVSSCRM